MRVVIVGGGFGGLTVAQRLGKAKISDMEITIVDRRNHHLFQPLLYQVAMAGLSPADITAPIRRVLRKYQNVHCRLANATHVDAGAKMLVTDSGSIPYDRLVLACGATHSYFGNDEWEEHAPGLKTIEQATEIRRRVLTAFEQAELATDAETRKELLTFVVVGGGPTGVELAGALGEISRYTLSKDFRNVDPSRTRVILIEGGKRVLSAFADDLSHAAARSLEKLGVTIWTESLVTRIDGDGVWIGDEHVRAKTVLWAAGVEAAALGRTLGVELDSAGRVPVQKDLSLETHPEIFVIGDMARFEDKNGEVLPGVAPVALQQGRKSADNILRDHRKKDRQPFEYFDKGIMATVGRASAVMQSGNIRLSGLLAWLGWCFVHILYLIGFRNRFIVLTQWMWSYFRFKRGARLITARDWRLDRSHRKELSSSSTPDGVGTDDGD